LNKKVLKISLDDFDFKHAKIGKRLPVVFSRDEALDVLSNLHGEFNLMTSLLYGNDIRTVQELLGYKDVRTTMRYTHVLNRNKFNVRSPLDV
jgi:hypothetical protein